MLDLPLVGDAAGSGVVHAWFAIVCYCNDLLSFAIILLKKRVLVALRFCIVAVCVLCLFLTIQQVGPQPVIVVFPCHTKCTYPNKNQQNVGYDLKS